MDARDIKKQPPKVGVDGAFPMIWELQEALIVEYKKIESMPDYPLDLDLKKNQELMKDFIARVTEELAESHEAYMDNNFENTKEELADAMHFLVEAMIFTGSMQSFINLWKPAPGETLFESLHADPPMRVNNLIEWYWSVTYFINIARNNLRNKKWKQSQVLAQKSDFRLNLLKGLAQLVAGFHLLGMSEQDIFEIYWKKNQINWFRIKSKY